jgi:hypothetical protein
MTSIDFIGVTYVREKMPSDWNDGGFAWGRTIWNEAALCLVAPRNVPEYLDDEEIQTWLEKIDATTTDWFYLSKRGRT